MADTVPRKATASPYDLMRIERLEPQTVRHNYGVDLSNKPDALNLALCNLSNETLFIRVYDVASSTSDDDNGG